jgi:hypothetical protein
LNPYPACYRSRFLNIQPSATFTGPLPGLVERAAVNSQLLTAPSALQQRHGYIFILGIAFGAGFATGVPTCKRASHLPLRFTQIVVCRSGPIFGAAGGVTR